MATKKKAAKKAAKKSAKKSTAKKSTAKRAVAKKKPVAKKSTATRRPKKMATADMKPALVSFISVLKNGGASVLGLVEKTPCSRPTVYKYLRDLKALGHKIKITKVRGEGKTRGPEASFYQL